MKITNDYNMPVPFYKAVLADIRRPSSSGYGITTLQKHPKQHQLAKRNFDERVEDCADHTFRLLGKAGHAVFEGHAVQNSLQEEYIEIDFEYEVGKSVKLRMVADLYNGDEKRITDYKFATVYKWKRRDFGDVTEQLNGYAGILRILGFAVEKLDATFLFKDWSKAEAYRYGPDVAAARDKKFDYPIVGTKRVQVDLWPQEKCVRWLKERISLHVSYEETPDEELPECTSEDKWQPGEAWAVMVKGRKRSLKNHPTMEAAIEHARAAGGEVEHRPAGMPMRCELYCDAKPFCKQYKDERGSWSYRPYVAK